MDVVFSVFSRWQRFRRCINADKIFRSLGAWSYSNYLIHWLVYEKLPVVQHGWIFALVPVLGSIGTGALLYLLMEAPMEKFRHFLQRKISLKQPLPA